MNGINLACSLYRDGRGLMSVTSPKSSDPKNPGTGGNVIGLKGVGGHGNVLTGTRHMVSAGSYTAAHAGFSILEAGGNAVKANRPWMVALASG